MNLTNLGITNEEYIAYTEILKNPPTELAELAKRSKIKRSTLYNILEQLVHKKLIYEPSGVDNIRYYAVEPSKLIEYVEANKKDVDEQMAALKAQLPLLNVFLKTEKFTDTTEYYSYPNDEAPFFMEEICDQSQEQMYGLSAGHWFDVTFDVGDDKKVKHTKYLDTVLRIGDRFVFTGDTKARVEAKAYLEANPQLVGKWEARWIDQSRFNFDMNINTFEDKVLLSVQQQGFTKGEGWVTHYIRNEKIARAFQQLSQFLWENAEDLNPKKYPHTGKDKLSR